MSVAGGPGAGWTGGGLAGYDFQSGSLVVGPEFDYATAWSGGSNTTAAASFTTQVGQNWNARGRVRVGYAEGDWLFYAAGGYSEANFNVNLSAPGHSAGGSITLGGWNAGLGVEYAINRYFSARAEYVYDTYANATFNPNNPWFSPQTLSGMGANTYRAALNWNF